MTARGNVAMIARPAVLLALAAWLALLAPPSAPEEPKASLCNFVNGITHSCDKGAYTAEKASPLSFGIAASHAGAQTAELKTRGRTGHLRIVQAVNAMHFLEVVTEGFLHVTTVYD